MIRAILRRLGQLAPKDTPWEPTGIRYTFTGHDQTKAAAVHEREQRQAAARRAKSAKARQPQRVPRPNVESIRRAK